MNYSAAAARCGVKYFHPAVGDDDDDWAFGGLAMASPGRAEARPSGSRRKQRCAVEWRRDAVKLRIQKFCD